MDEKENVVVGSTETTQPKIKAKRTTGKSFYASRRITIGCVLIVAAILLAVIAVPLLTKKSDTYGVFTLRKDISAGTLINNENFDELFEAYDTEDLSLANKCVPSTQEAAEGLLGQYVVNDRKAGDLLKPDDVATMTIYHSDLVPEGKELVAMRVGSMAADIGFTPQVGDIVRFYGLEADVTYTSPYTGAIARIEEAEAVIYDLLQYVEIYRILDGDGHDTFETHAAPANMIITASIPQVKQLIEAQETGFIYLSLVSSGNKQTAKELLAKQDRIVEISELKKTMTDVLEKEPVSIFKDLLVYGANGEEYLPTAGDSVSFMYVQKIKRREMNEKGELVDVERTELAADPLLECVKLKTLYDENGIDMYVGLTDDDETSETEEPDVELLPVREFASAAYELTPEQLARLQDLFKEEAVFVVPILGKSPEELGAMYEAIDDRIREARIHEIDPDYIEEN